MARPVLVMARLPGSGASARTCRVASRSAARAASAMMVSAGLAAPWVGSTLPSTTNRLGTPKTRWSASTTPSSGRVAIRAPPTRWAYRSMVMTSCGAGGVQDGLHRLLRGAHQLPVVVALGVGEVRDGQAVPVGLVGEGDPVAGVGEEFAERAEGGPVHVVAHVLPQRFAPVSLRGDVFGPGDRQRADGLDGPAALVGLARVGLVELFAADLRRRRLVHADLVVEPAGGLRGALHHQVAADLVVVVAQPVRDTGGWPTAAAAAGFRCCSRRRRPPGRVAGAPPRRAGR